VYAPAPTWGDTTEFLDIDMEELSGVGSFVTDHLAGWLVDSGETIQAMPAQHPFHR
jgi:hypothetical protein